MTFGIAADDDLTDAETNLTAVLGTCMMVQYMCVY